MTNSNGATGRPLRVVVCPDSFKGSLGAAEAARAFAKGVLGLAPTAQVIELPMADGGEGTAEALVAAAQAAGEAGAGDVASNVEDESSQVRLGRFVAWHEVAVSGLEGALTGAEFRPVVSAGCETGHTARWAEFEGGVAVLDVASAIGFSQLTASGVPEFSEESEASEVPEAQGEQNATSQSESSDAKGCSQSRWKGVSSYAAGELLRDVLLDSRISRVYVGLGGTATSDCGLGLLCALGAQAYDDKNQSLEPCAGSLARVARLDVNQMVRAQDKHIYLLLDVDNPLVGPSGAVRTFGPQKGVPAEELAALDAAFAWFSGLVERTFGVEAKDLAGAGAAGGLGFALMSALGATGIAGGQAVLRLCGAPALFERADLIITGEGRLDAQTARGKVVRSVCELAMRGGSRPIVGAVAGQNVLSPAEVGELGLFWAEDLVSLAPDENSARADAARWAEQASARLFARWVRAWSGAQRWENE